ncbi:hypothetical protein FRC17_010286 [Serendipita sp. 399]|nr:hypothetical protein FRC17_010286 [Serendipita sp. 399]
MTEEYNTLKKKAGNKLQISRPEGEAGRKTRKRNGVETGKVFNLRKASRLSKAHYKALQTLVKIYTYKYADPTKTWKKNEAHLGEVIAAVRQRIPNVDTYAEPSCCWIVKDLMKIFLRSSSDALKKTPKSLVFLDPDSEMDEDSDTNSDEDENDEDRESTRDNCRKRKSQPGDEEQRPTKRPKTATLSTDVTKSASSPTDDWGITNWNDREQFDPVYKRLLVEAGYDSDGSQAKNKKIVATVREKMKQARQKWKKRQDIYGSSHSSRSPPNSLMHPESTSLEASSSMGYTLRPKLQAAVFTPEPIQLVAKSSRSAAPVQISPERLRQVDWEDEASVEAIETEIFEGDVYAKADNKTRDRIDAWWAGYTTNKSSISSHILRNSPQQIASTISAVSGIHDTTKQQAGLSVAQSSKMAMQAPSDVAKASAALASILPSRSVKPKWGRIESSDDSGEDEVDLLIQKKMEAVASQKDKGKGKVVERTRTSLPQTSKDKRK